MEKLLRRSILNRNQLVTKKRRETAKDIRKTWRDFNRMKNAQSNELNRILKNERLARREDWVMGPLAPKRDVGAQKQTYGAVDTVLAQGAQLPRREVKGPRGQGHDAFGSEDRRMPGFEDGEWRGEGLQGNLVTGDRVVVTKGRLGLKGKIGEVIRIDKKADMVFIKGVNKVDMKIPPQALANANGEHVFEQEIPIPTSDVLLVLPMQNPQTGLPQDYIVRHVYGGHPFEQRNPGSNLPRHTRYIKGFKDSAGEDIPIPWPKEDPDRYYAQDCDTTSIELEKVTYFPQVQTLPLFPGAIDELRNKHARPRRDLDDQDFMRKKMLEDARRDWFNERSRVLSEPFWTREYMQTMERRAAQEKRGEEV